MAAENSRRIHIDKRTASKEIIDNVTKKSKDSAKKQIDECESYLLFVKTGSHGSAISSFSPGEIFSFMEMMEDFVCEAMGSLDDIRKQEEDKNGEKI